jgi:glutamate synthase domain-containing protein 2
MAKFASDFVLDASLSVVSQATRMVATVGQPTTYAAADAGKLVEAVMAPADFSVADGDISGRKVAVAAKLGLDVLTPGTADHVALLDAANQRLLYVTTCPAQLLPGGGTVNIAGWNVEIGDPV